MSREVAVIASDNASFQLACADAKLNPANVHRVMHPDNLRGARLERVIWASTPFNWDQNLIEEARVNIDLALRAGEGSDLVGRVPMTRAEAIALLYTSAQAHVDHWAGTSAESRIGHDKVRDAFRALGVSRGELGA